MLKPFFKVETVRDSLDQMEEGSLLSEETAEIERQLRLLKLFQEEVIKISEKRELSQLDISTSLIEVNPCNEPIMAKHVVLPREGIIHDFLLRHRGVDTFLNIEFPSSNGQQHRHVFLLWVSVLKFDVY